MGRGVYKMCTWICDKNVWFSHEICSYVNWCAKNTHVVMSKTLVSYLTLLFATSYSNYIPPQHILYICVANNTHQYPPSITITSTPTNFLHLSTSHLYSYFWLDNIITRMSLPTHWSHLGALPPLFSHKCLAQHHKFLLPLASLTRLLPPCCQCSPTKINQKKKRLKNFNKRILHPHVRVNIVNHVWVRTFGGN